MQKTMKNKKNALLLFAKYPLRGRVKTRLQPELSTEQAWNLYREMVFDLVRYLRHRDTFDLKIFYYPRQYLPGMKRWLGEDQEYHAQRGANLGEKMYLAMAEIFKQNYKKVIIIGSDVPTISTALINHAFWSLEIYDLILGPSFDGGYYLIGSKNLYRELFRNIQWSSENVLKQTLHRARSIFLSYFLLHEMWDIDTVDDVRRLWRLLKDHRDTRNYDYLSGTHRVLSEIFS
ncbi:DUF2064 domain-containing protein [candidate division KSB1 bacterium]|nr:DUF2064 domain-containing protein [candidate division KSB1 bacterium]